MKNLLVCLTIPLLFLAMSAVAESPNPQPPHGSTYKLLYGMQDAVDPLNPNNYVVGVTTTAAVIGAVSRKFGDRPQVEDFTDQLSLKYYFVARTCAGGSPRFQLSISPSGDNNDPNTANAFGYLGDKAFGGGCPANKWVYEDMTDAAPKWDLSKFSPSASLTCASANSMICTWSEVVTYFQTNFPNHKVLNFVLADDSCSFALTSCGTAYFDLVSAGDDSLESKSDTGQ